jgi:hypothetical protein
VEEELEQQWVVEEVVLEVRLEVGRGVASSNQEDLLQRGQYTYKYRFVAYKHHYLKNQNNSIKSIPQQLFGQGTILRTQSQPTR